VELSGGAVIVIKHSAEAASASSASNYEVDSLADLDEKLMQYPAPSAFRWQTGGASSSQKRDMRDRVQALLMKHGMSLVCHSIAAQSHKLP
jgi:hypothetical protein